jgi:acyl-CoA synthetase (NDP forming)
MTWESLLRQAGAIEVHSFDGLVDIALALLCLSTIESGSVALIGTGGGASVVGADECEEAGLTVSPLPKEAVKALSRFIPREGTSLWNPLDLPWGQTSQELQKTIAIVASCRQIASLIIHLEVDSILHFFGWSELTKITDAIVAAARDCIKPVTVALRTSGFPEAVKPTLEQQQVLVAAGIPAYPTIRRAAQAISRILQHQRSIA